MFGKTSPLKTRSVHGYGWCQVSKLSDDICAPRPNVLGIKNIFLREHYNIGYSATSCGAGGTLSRDTVGIYRVTHMSLVARGPSEIYNLHSLSVVLLSTPNHAKMMVSKVLCTHVSRWARIRDTGYLAVTPRAVVHAAPPMLTRALSSTCKARIASKVCNACSQV